jgi:hypothetical protein
VVLATSIRTAATPNETRVRVGVICVESSLRMALPITSRTNGKRTLRGCATDY